MKKFYFSMVAMMLVAAMTASAAEDFWYNGIAYKIIGTDSVEVTRPTGGYTSLGGAIVFPETVYNNNKSYTVAAIGESAFLIAAASLFSISSIIFFITSFVFSYVQTFKASSNVIHFNDFISQS